MRWRARLAMGLVVMGLVVVCLGGGACLGLPVAEPVDINRATVAELMRVPGMTASWAGRIVRFRPYRSKLDLLEQGMVSQDVYRRIRDGVVAHRIEGFIPGKTKRSYDGQDTR